MHRPAHVLAGAGAVTPRAQDQAPAQALSWSGRGAMLARLAVPLALVLPLAIAGSGCGDGSKTGASSGTTASGSGGVGTAGGSGSGTGTSSGGTAPVTSGAPPVTGADVLTWHNDNARTGQNLAEPTLTPATVNPAGFGKLALWPVDGHVDAQPPYASAVPVVGGAARNLLVVATENDTVYGFDVDRGTPAWQVSLLGSGETPSDTRSCSQVTPQIGISATPVIDRTRGTSGAVYVVAMSKTASNQYVQRLHALDLASGADLVVPVVVTATYPGSGDGSSGASVVFDPAQYKERAALLLQAGVLYTTWASHCDIRPYTGWVISFDAATLARRDVLNLAPNGEGAAFWAAGAGPATDASGSIYFLAANGTFDTQLTAAGLPSQGDYGNAFLRFSTGSAPLAVADYFATHDTVAQSSADSDLGSGGTLVLPDLIDSGGAIVHLAVGAGKDGHIYLVNRDQLGHFNASTNNIYQDLVGALSGSVYSAPAYFNGAVYYGAVGDALKAFTLAAARLPASATSRSASTFAFPGTTPSVSASGAAAGIVWAVENGATAVLHAYDAGNLASELYNSSQSGTRDQFGAGNKFITPTVTGGRVYVGTPDAVAVFGLLH